MRPQSGLLSDILANLKGKKQCCANTVRSGSMLENMVGERKASKKGTTKKFDVI